MLHGTVLYINWMYIRISRPENTAILKNSEVGLNAHINNVLKLPQNSSGRQRRIEPWERERNPFSLIFAPPFASSLSVAKLTLSLSLTFSLRLSFLIKASALLCFLCIEIKRPVQLLPKFFSHLLVIFNQHRIFSLFKLPPNIFLRRKETEPHRVKKQGS